MNVFAALALSLVTIFFYVYRVRNAKSLERLPSSSFTYYLFYVLFNFYIFQLRQ